MYACSSTWSGRSQIETESMGWSSLFRMPRWWYFFCVMRVLSVVWSIRWVNLWNLVPHLQAANMSELSFMILSLSVLIRCGNILIRCSISVLSSMQILQTIVLAWFYHPAIGWKAPLSLFRLRLDLITIAFFSTQIRQAQTKSYPGENGS